MKLTIIESPYAPNESYTVEHHIEYAQKCMHDSLLRGEAPYASHLLYTQPNVLDDTIKDERALGIQAGFEWRKCAELTVFYCDLGMSKGMLLGMEDCKAKGLPYEVRRILEPATCK